MTRIIRADVRVGVLRPIWFVVCAVVLAALGTVPLAGTAAAASGVPCGVSNGACVALGAAGFNGSAWLMRAGKVARGPVSALTGGPGEDTPTGTFQVISKDLHHVSTATRDARGRPSPMPYSVFFGHTGVAFHGTEPGDDSTNRTAGCVRLTNGDASYFFNHLNVGDTVQVVRGNGRYPGGAPDKSDHGDGGGGGLLGGL